MSKKTEAPGNAAGYIFQFERVLYWLSKGNSNTKVGVEIDDDIKIQLIDGKVKFEQDKHSIDKNKNIFNNRSVELWKTIYNWIFNIRKDNIRIDMCTFLIVTNKVVNSNLLIKIIDSAKTKEEVNKCIETMKQIVNEPSDSIKKYVEYIFNNIKILKELIPKINLIDGSESSYGKGLRKKISDELHISTEMDSETIIKYLYGWIIEQALELWRNGEQVWYDVNAFNRVYNNIVIKLQNETYIGIAEKAIPINISEINRNKNKLFVKQLKLISDEDDIDIIIDGIKNFIRYKKQKIYLCKRGNVTEEDFINFRNELCNYWKPKFNKMKLNIRRESNKKEVNVSEIKQYYGCDLYYEMQEYKSFLGNYRIQEFYLNRGGLHELSNELKIGWHIDYKKILNKELEGDIND
ncbi:ABC-three component system protein [Clostridium botulinum]|uniref:ABC-three component system protein n=1 Tax=Clostridium botulinum TaxID=1491 RepID=UPI0007DE7B66|nr:ABC-three component system protein [Clostridium botulinum]KEI92419.1 hypothetical protein N491_11345 [Clostridium botulinum B2 275]NFD57569.1 hypothetical protein [Clostridium botulinum]